MAKITLRTWSGSSELTLDGGALTHISNGKTTVVPLSQIVSFQITKEPKGKMKPGIITIALAGASGTRVLLNSFMSVGGSNNIEFAHGYDYAQAAHAMQAAIAAYRSAPAAPASQDLRELKSLLDDGIITQAEFDAKKKQILGL